MENQENNKTPTIYGFARGLIRVQEDRPPMSIMNWNLVRIDSSSNDKTIILEIYRADLESELKKVKSLIKKMENNIDGQEINVRK